MNRVTKFIQRNSGFTLIELLITSVILVIMITVVGQVYIVGMVQSKSDMAKAKLQIEGKSAMEGIVNNIKLSSAVETTHFGYTSGPQVLILKIPAITEDENFLYNPPGGSTRDNDYVIYYLENKNLHKLVESSNVLSRLYSENGTNNVILSNVKTLSFAYDPVIPDVSKVTVNITIENTNYKKVIEVPLSGEVTIRND